MGSQLKQLLSFTEYAKHRGVSKAAVSKAVKEGRVTPTLENGGRFIDWKKADAEWIANSVPGQRSAGGENGVSPEVEAAPDGPKRPSYADHRAIKELYSAKMLQLEYKERMGTLIKADQVKKDAFRLARVVRDTILSLPDKISHELAAETDPHGCHVILTKALIEALDHMVRINVG